jgi:hypothetical protein
MTVFDGGPSFVILALSFKCFFFEYRNQVICNMTVFDGGPLFVVLALSFSIQTKTSFFNMTLFDRGSEGLGVRLRFQYEIAKQ